MSDLKMKDKANDKWEMKKEDVTVCEELGHGAFGRVCKGIIKASSCMTQSSYVQQTSKVEAKSKITVVVKTLQGTF